MTNDDWERLRNLAIFNVYRTDKELKKDFDDPCFWWTILGYVIVVITIIAVIALANSQL